MTNFERQVLQTEAFYDTQSCTIIPDSSGLGSPNYLMSGWWSYDSCVQTTETPFLLLTDTTALKLVGDGAIRAFPYDGVAPHGMMLETFYSEATVGGYTGALIVKRNYGPEGVELDQVLADPGKHLGAVTVMFQREEGYDPDNNDWFWAKYLPDGSLDKNPKGMRLAGMVAKGADVGCIACHSGAGDYIFTTDAKIGR